MEQAVINSFSQLNAKMTCSTKIVHANLEIQILKNHPLFPVVNPQKAPTVSFIQIILSFSSYKEPTEKPKPGRIKVSRACQYMGNYYETSL